MEKELKDIDFSRFSKVQASLKERLLASYNRGVCPLGDDELDIVAAAGRIQQYDKKNR